MHADAANHAGDQWQEKKKRQATGEAAGSGVMIESDRHTRKGKRERRAKAETGRERERKRGSE